MALIVLATTSAFAPIFNGDEARFAQASQTMAVGDDWIVPTFAGAPRYDKPILIYWVTAASLRLLGRSAFAARLPSAAAAALSVALIAWTARRRWGRGSGLAAGILLLASPVFFFEGRVCTADSLNFLWTLLAMLALERLTTDRGQPKALAAAVFWIALGLAVLTKGPVAPLFIVSTLLGVWAMTRRWRRWETAIGLLLFVVAAFGLGPIVILVPMIAASVSALRHGQRPDRFHLSWGVPLALFVVLPWTAAAWRATSGEYFATAVGRHVIERGQSGLEGHGAFPGFYLATAFIACFPFFGSALAASVAAWRRRRESAGEVFMLAWAVGPLVVLETVQTRLVHYWLPSYPALILLAVGWIWTGRRVLGRSALWVSAAGGIALSIVPVVVPLVYGIPDLIPAAIALSAFSLAATTVGMRVLGRTPRLGVEVAAGGAILFLSVLLGPFVAAAAHHGIGPRSARVARAESESGSPVAVFGLRDEDVLFSLPPDAPVVRRPAELDALLLRQPETVVCVRQRDFDRHLRDSPHRWVVIAKVVGIDLMRARPAATLFLRRLEAP